MKKKEAIQDGKIDHEQFREAYLQDAELAMKKLEEHNKSQDGRKKAQVFYIQGFAVMGVSEAKSRKVLRSIMGRIILNPDVELDALRDTMVAIKKSTMPNGDK
jgi:hypothetical protein